MSKSKYLSGWGRYPFIETKEIIPSSVEELMKILKNQNGTSIARGNGRSYGDSSINSNLTIKMTNFNKLIEFDDQKGEIIAESGVLLEDIIDFVLPKGFFPSVTPGSKFVTLGGSIACDVHGKNHHNEGSFGHFVKWFEIIDNSNQLKICSNEENPELFKWTIGGMGLTGIITKCCIKLKRIETGWITQKTITNKNLNDTLQAFNKFEDSTYSVAWIDCLAKGKGFGRSILLIGEHSKINEISHKSQKFPSSKKQIMSIFFELPNFLLNNFTVSVFNNFYFFIKRLFSIQILDWDSYFYPLDSIKNWNKLYGRKGFFQFQCVLPEENSLAGLSKILKVVQKKSSGSFLAVLKKFGPGVDTFSFPMEGYTLALDFKATKRNILAARELTNIVKEMNGRIYLAKDALMNESEFDGQYKEKHIEELKKLSLNKKNSEQFKRLGL